jgi:LCP family protein required for cell wall assembly
MAPSDPDRPEYSVYRARRRGLLARLKGEDETVPDRGRDRKPKDRGSRPKGEGVRGAITPRRVLKWVALAVGGWILLSLLLFLVSAQIERGKTSGAADGVLAGGFPLFSKSTILVLGADRRPKSSKEPGAHSGPSRSDTIMLMRVGGGAAARLSIPRDTVVNIPGHGESKINAAYAFGGTKLAIQTVQAFTGVRVNHVIEVDFTNFPKFIDAMGGVDVTIGCVKAEISGGTKNGGQTIRFKAGKHHLDGTQALALSRIRHNACNPAESDLTRVRRQQKILSAIKDQLVGPGTFFRLPWVSWDAPKAIKTDMGGPSLLGLAAAMGTGGTPPIRVLKPSGNVTLPDGEEGLSVAPATVKAQVAKFLKG